MEPGKDKNKQKEQKEQIRMLEREMKSAFREGDYETIKKTAENVKKLDPENHLAEKLIRKAEKIRAKEDKIVRLRKAKEYKTMLKKLYKEHDLEKLTALAKEFKRFDPENRHADKWLFRTEKLKKKLSGKQEEKKEKEPVKIETRPTPPIQAAPFRTAPAPAALKKITPVKEEEPAKETAPETAPETAKKEAKGNIFTKMFGKKEEEIQKKSIIDTIVAKTDKKAEKKVSGKEVKKPVGKKEGAGFLTFSKIFMNFTVIFIVLSAAFLYVEWVDKENTILSLAGISENTGGKLHNASEKASAMRKQKEILDKDIELYKGGYEDKAVSTVETIIDERINWPDIFAKINEVTNSIYELNDFFKYIEYNNYSFDAENGTIRVTGTLSDPLGRNLTKLVELEEAFKYYPKDKDNPDDTTKPYFAGFRELTSFSKTLDSATGRYSSSFQLSFALNE